MFKICSKYAQNIQSSKKLIINESFKLYLLQIKPSRNLLLKLNFKKLIFKISICDYYSIIWLDSHNYH